MRAVPVDLDNLRRLAELSYCWRKGRDTLTLAQWEKLPEEQRKGWKWAADMALVDRLCEAESAHTDTHGWAILG
jgi:hypothetical protein